MDSRERLLTALQNREPDRVPFLESVVEEPVAIALLKRDETRDIPQEAWHKKGPVSTGFRPPSGHGYHALEIVRDLGLDAMGMHFYLPNLSIQKEVGGRTMTVGGQISSKTDLAKIQLPDPDDPTLYEPLRCFVDQYRHTGLALFCRVPLGADPVILGMGLEKFSYALFDDYPLIETLFDMYTDWYMRAMKHLCAIDFDFIWSGEDIAHKSGPYLSPKMFRKLFMPYYRRVAQQIKKPWIFHSDGNLMPVIDDLLSLGMNGLHPIEPGPMNLAEMKRRFGQRLCLCGHINLDTLSRGTPEEVDRLVQDAISIAAPSGGYIAGSSNSVTSYCKPENVRAMANAIKQYGVYPFCSHLET
jgi:uroporphyrinogen decarboxylase